MLGHALLDEDQNRSCGQQQVSLRRPDPMRSVLDHVAQHELGVAHLHRFVLRVVPAELVAKEPVHRSEVASGGDRPRWLSVGIGPAAVAADRLVGQNYLSEHVYLGPLDSTSGSLICVVPVNIGLPVESLIELAMAMFGKFFAGAPDTL